MEARTTILPEANALHSGKLKRFLLQAGGAILLLLAGRAIWYALPHETHQHAASFPAGTLQNTRAAAVSLLSVAPMATPQWLEVTGTVQSELQAPIGSKIVARIQKMLVREGDRVRHGQPLVVLEARDMEASIAQANAGLRAARVGYDTAHVAARMEDSLSAARIAEAQAKGAQSEAALQAATARLELVKAGPRRQEREQAALAVSQAQSNLTLAQSNLKRMSTLYEEGAISAQQYDQYRSQFEVARSQFQTAQQGKSLADEGSRVEEIQAAQQAVRQAQAAVQEARAGLNSAQASAMQTEVRRQEVQGAQAQIGQSQASLRLATVNRDYTLIAAPFDGIVTKRLADPGVMASPGLPLLTMQGGDLRLEAVVPESALVAVHPGASVPVRFDALHDRALTGRVIEIAPQGDASSHTFVVKINLPSLSGASAGMFGRARFTTGTEKRLLVPLSAVFEREGLHYLYVVDKSDIARLRMVTVGNPTEKRLPILSGLSSGERIVSTGKEQITDGSPVAEGSR